MLWEEEDEDEDEEDLDFLLFLSDLFLFSVAFSTVLDFDSLDFFNFFIEIINICYF